MKEMLESAISKLIAPYTPEQIAIMRPTLDEIVENTVTKAKSIRIACEDDKTAFRIAALELYKYDNRKKGMAMLIINNI